MTTYALAEGSSEVTGLLCDGFGGRVHLPGDHEYDEQRRPLFPTMDPRPDVVAEAFGVADVLAAVRAARYAGLPLAVQATGHGTRIPSDGGVLLRTGGMASVLVDPRRRIAKVGPGARWGEVIDAAAPFGLAPLAGSSRDVGVTGYTLGGGLGWLGRKYGFAADSVVRAEVVTADGGVVTASADENPDLFWAIRGGSGNFGIVTSLEFRLYSVAVVYAGITYHPIERAPETLAYYRRWIEEIPDELSTAVLLTKIPDSPDYPEELRGRRALAIKAMYAGEAALAEAILQKLWEVAGPVQAGGLRQVPFGEASMGGTAARYLDLVDELPDGLIDVLTGLEGEPTVEIRHWGGAMARADERTGPVGHRSAPFSLIIDQEQVDAEKLRNTGRTFLNFLADPARTESAYAADDYRRLRAVKWTYDPDNFFHLNHNIPPA